MVIDYLRALYANDMLSSRTTEKHLFAQASVPESLPELLGQSFCPFLVIHGTDDVFIPVDNGIALLRFIPSAKLHILKGAGFMFFDHATWNEILHELVTHFRSSG